MAWRAEILNEAVAAEIAALPVDMQARFLRLSDRISQAGLESLGEPHVKHLEAMGASAGRPRRNSPRPLHYSDRPEGSRGSRIREKDTEDAAR